MGKESYIKQMKFMKEISNMVKKMEKEFYENTWKITNTTNM